MRVRAHRSPTVSVSRAKNMPLHGVDDGFHSAVEESFESESAVASPRRVGSASKNVSKKVSFSPSPVRSRMRGASAPCSPATDGGCEFWEFGGGKGEGGGRE